MARGKVDMNDAVVSPFFVLSAAISVGIVQFDLYGFDFGAPLFSIGSADISTAMLISVLALVTAYATNRPDFTKMGGVETYVAIATLGLVVGPPFIPMLDAILGYTGAGLVALVIQSSGFYALSYLG
ncbi:hypothetical protein ACKVMT_13925 [Halobacteriales archaeon Cl-PHB]